MMDAAALVIPAAAMDGRDSEQLVSLSTDRCSSVIGRREEVDGLCIPESTNENIMAYSELSRSSVQLSSFHCQDTREEHKFASSSMSCVEGKQIRRKSGKMAINSSGFSKRSRMGMMEDLLMNEIEANDVKEKSQITKPKNGLNGKRVDRRNGKVSMKSKYDFFALKAGMVSFNSGSGGNNSLGICGLKQDAYDVTKHLDELTVKDLLDGHYKGPALAKDMGKKAANLNYNFVNAVRNACSILQRKKPLKVQSSAEIDDSYNLSISVVPGCVDASKNDNEKGDTCIADLLSLSKVPPKVLDFRLCQPKYILECVALPPPVDLDDLLVDAAKPVVFAKDIIDSRGKQISHRASLAYADASTCRSKWVKIENTTALFEGRSSFLSEFDSLNYDPKLVPVKSMNYLPPATCTAPSASVSFPFIDFGSSSSATCSRASPLSSEYGSNWKHEEHVGDSPRSLAAARTLCDIKQLRKQDQHQKMMWTSKLSDKTVKACTLKPNNKLGEIFTKPEPVVSSHGLVKSKETSSISKKPRLLINEKGKDLDTGTKGLVNWSVPRSSTQTPSKSYRDNHANIRGYNSFMMPPPSSRVFDKACSRRERLRLHRNCI